MANENVTVKVGYELDTAWGLLATCREPQDLKRIKPILPAGKLYYLVFARSLTIPTPKAE